MKVTVFGANGRVGSLVVQLLLEQGHTVVAFVHNNETTDKDNLIVVKGDVRDKQKVSESLKGSDAVVSALGSWGTETKDILTIGMENIIPAMQANGVKRIISLTGADARASNDNHSIIHKASYLLFTRLAGKILLDGERHIELLAESGLDWTVIRSPVMNRIGDARYHLNGSRPLPWESINREAVAAAMIDQLTSGDYYRKAPFIHR